MIEVKGCTDAKMVLSLVEDTNPPDARVPLLITESTLAGTSGVDLLVAVHDTLEYRATRKILLGDQATAEELTRALNRGALDRTLSEPWTDEELGHCVRSLLTSYLIHHAPEEAHRFASLLDTEQLPHAYTAAQQNRQTLDLQMATPTRGFLANMDMGDEQVEQAMQAAIDEALDSPPRQTHKAGATLLRQGEPVNAISILLSGHVELSRRMEDHEVVLHTHSSGRIIGLLSLAHRGRAFYTCRAVTDVTVLPLTLKQLEKALQADPWLSGYFVTALIRSMATRSMRTAQLKVEVENLNRRLRGERDQLADALQRLEHAQMHLVESEKMATLGLLTAGIAHELNNPVAAIRRAADFIAEDTIRLSAQHPNGETIKETISSAMTSTPVSTRELREKASALFAAVGDDSLTRRLVKIGITSPKEYKARFGALSAKKREQLLSSIEKYHELGTSLRNLRICSNRISEIVRSLRSYSRSEQDLINDIDIHEGLEDTLRILDHVLQDIEVKRSYAELPGIECKVGELNQVWTNVISNAAQAMAGVGTLQIRTDAPDPDHARVRIIDNGKGIPADVIDRIFDLRFTTKSGRVEFGLGMGLSICRQIVTRHGGTITAESKPGETCFAITLPTRYPREPEDGTRS
ncbi:MAG: cyclic nucleotide-binding domain-containing protein [Phycisphaerales bacterium]|nr:MAG: cyclic nucleotide-binding domain-containing protein [Phycisphaerales bacterium]